MTETIQFTESGLAMALKLRNEGSHEAIRVYLDGKGCDGFFYGVCFDEKRADDCQLSQDDLMIVVDPETLKFVRGSTIEWADDERGKGFIVSNPNHRKFRGKFFKRSNWEDRLM